MPAYELKKLSSQSQVTDTLQELLGGRQDLAGDEQFHAEWNVIRTHILKTLLGQGQEGWDFNLMDWPADVLLFNVTLNRVGLSTAVSMDDMAALLASLKLSWCIRLECWDRIQNGLMVYGEQLQDALVLKGRVYLWEQRAAAGTS